MSEKWLWMSAADLGRGIEAGEIDPLALTQTYLAAAEGHECTGDIYARLTQDRALHEAQAAKTRADNGQRLGLLDGVPLSWKDLFDSAGVATESGSALLKDRVPERDSAMLQQASAAGTVCLGKTHLSELAFSGLGYNPITATSPCVNDPDAVAGGSSSGAAASVAFGLAPAAIGSDTGGSVRIPAAWNDLVGLKTTSGLLSLEGAVPLCPRFDTVGPLTRNVEDAGLLLAMLSGQPGPDLQNAHASDLSGAKIAVLTTMAFDGIREEPLHGFDRARAALAATGAEISGFEAPCVQEAMDLAGVLYTAEAYGIWGEAIEAQPEAMFAPVRARFMAGKDVMARDYIRAWRELERLRAQWLALVAEYDAVILPTAPILPPNKARLAADSEYYTNENLLALRNTRIGNLMGLCALTLPSGVPSAGVMVLGQPMGEAALLRIGAAMEAALG
ncbi:MAG: amidase [Mangrovicoccus sp.]|nr:amidase [Mangrovicoccus sp.]